MRSYLPLNSLRAFESAARHLSFAKAAKELCVTPTAISHHVRILEEFLEASLFERHNGKLQLTAAAAAVLDDLSEGFNRLECAMAPLKRRPGRRKVTVAASPSVASLWLVPKLQRFFTLAPDVDVSVTTVISPGGYGPGNYDVVICNSRDSNGRRAEYLMEEQIFPICAPAVMPHGLDGEAALRQLPLIHDDKLHECYPTWARYLQEYRIAGRDAEFGLRFNQSSLAVAAAEEGHGMLLGRSRLIGRALARRKVRPVSDQLKAITWHYYLLCQSGSSSRPVQLFVDWLRTEVEAEDVNRAPTEGALASA